MGRRHHWAVLLLWWSRPPRYCEWESLASNDNRIFLAPIRWYGLGGHVVPTERRHKPHSECHNHFIGNQVWRTCYLTKWSRLLAAWVVPLDYFLWGCFKSMVYANKPATIDELARISNVNLCLKIVKNWVQRLDIRKRGRGGHAKEIKFHS